MTIFIYEHLTSGALAAEPFSSSLMHEGDQMLRALCLDLMALGHQICVLRDARLPALEQAAGLKVISISTPAEYQFMWRQCQQEYQQFVVIAPETDGILQQLVAGLEQRQKPHFGASSNAIALCTDKLACAARLQQQDLLTPDSFSANDWLNTSADNNATWIIKPVDGAGCEQTYSYNTPGARQYLSHLPMARLEQTLIQPRIDGEALSLSLFIEQETVHLLSVNRQFVSQSGPQLKLDACQPGYDHLISTEQAQRLAQQIHATIPGLWGFIGIDLVLSDQRLWIIDINPRLTSSYAEAAFRQNGNPALHLHKSLIS